MWESDVRLCCELTLAFLTASLASINLLRFGRIVRSLLIFPNSSHPLLCLSQPQRVESERETSGNAQQSGGAAAHSAVEEEVAFKVTVAEFLF